MIFFCLRFLSQKTSHRDSHLVTVLANSLKALYFRWLTTWMHHTFNIYALCYKCSVSVTCPLSLASFSWFSDYLEEKFIFCNGNFSLIISSGITLFGTCPPWKVIMIVKQLSLDLDLISWISELCYICDFRPFYQADSY